jgi:hypothetical protein
MAERAEAQAQIARMLGDPALRAASPEVVQATAAAAVDRLEAALIDEAAASDDVIDGASARFYVDRRLDFLATVLDEPTLARLKAGLRARVARW